MIVENRAGAGGNTGAQFVERSDPDGYTVQMAVNSYVINTRVYRNIPFDFRTDFSPFGLVATSPLALVVHPSLPIKTVTNLITFTKARPGELSFRSTGRATAPHLALELFKLRAGIDMRHIGDTGSGSNVTEQ